MSNVYEKLQKARIELQNTELKKSGYNKFAQYKYFELADFLPTVQNIFSRHGLFGHISFNTELAVLHIRAIDKPDETVSFLSPMSTASLKGCHDVQNLGAVQSYLRRYLWVNAMEIVEHDALDATTGKDTPSKKPEERILTAFTPEELAEEKAIAHVIEGKEPKIYSKADLEKRGWVIKVTSDNVTDQKAWLQEIKTAVDGFLVFCEKEEDVMGLFKKNKQLFDTVKELDDAFFKNMMSSFTERKNQLKEKVNG
jgi:hypothetical protein